MRAVVFLALLTTSAFAVDFVREVRPIFERHCHACHGAQKQKNDYRLDIKAVALTGGESHAPDIIAGNSAHSPLFRFVSGADKDLQMPPKSRLSSAEIETLRRWIDEGAVWPDGVDVAKLEDKTDWWAFKPLEVSSLRFQVSSSSPASASGQIGTLNLKLIPSTSLSARSWPRKACSLRQRRTRAR